MVADFSIQPLMGDHISVCICTYKRPVMLERLFKKLDGQQTGCLFTYSLVVVDNDRDRSAKKIAHDYRSGSGVTVEYYVVPEQNIAAARNEAVEHAKGNYIAFIDDDEFPEQDWLITLYKSCTENGASGVLGPVKPHFEHVPAKWIKKGKFFEKGFHRTGHILNWTETRTSNALLKNLFKSGNGGPFNPEFGRGGEDRDLFKRLIEEGHVFVWCNEAPVYETIPEERCTRKFFLRRALLRGKVAAQFSSFASFDTIKSIIAVAVYTAILPFAFLAGHHLFMKYLSKNFDHIGKLLGFLKFNVIKDNYVMCTDLERLPEERKITEIKNPVRKEKEEKFHGADC